MSNSTKIFQGKSQYNGEQVKAYYTSKSENTKTGNMPAIMILPKEKPTDAIKSGSDISVCGSCQLRPINGNKKIDSCYVNCGYAPNAVYMADKRGSVPVNESMYLLTKKPVKVQRHGGYGDSASLPKRVNLMILKQAKRTLSYTHAWKDKKNNYLKSFCMASVHSQEEALQAQALGFRTFRILQDDKEPLMDNEKLCLNTTKGLTCLKCQLCCGLQAKNAKNIAIVKH